SAKSYLEQKDTKAGIIQLKAALQRNPQSGEARFLLGKTLLESGDAAAAALELQKALDLKHDDNDVLPALARALLLQRDAKQVVAQFSRTRLQDPVSIADLKTSVAAAHLQLGANDRAEVVVEDALAASPDFAPALLLKARLLGAARNFSGALALCEQVLAKEPKNAEAWTIKGSLALFTASARAPALADFRKALDADPRYLPAHMNMLAVLMEQRDSQRTEAQIEELRKVLPNHPQTKFFESQLYYMRGESAKAREIAQLLLKLVPDNFRILQLAGAIELQDNKLLQAEQHLAKAVQLAPDLALARRLLAQTYLHSGQVEKALAALAPLLGVSSPTADSLALAAEAYLLKGDTRQAEQLFARAAKINPNDPQIRTAVALRRLAGGDASAAFAELEAVAASDPGTYADMALISARMRSNSLDKALQAIELLESKQPNRPFASYLRGRIYTRQQNTSAAAKSYERALAIESTYFPAATALAEQDLIDAKPNQAKQRFEAILKVDPKHTIAMLALGELRERTGGTPE
ncbi:MAG: PEP-CTERM system TPR-repeat protein PrsT, partial [Rubrivivax sp.]|nr:PEP-CTERM system TPR-repeat protein PrsT [Rubrivivax sp.]